jgi:hypothetical protein
MNFLVCRIFPTRTLTTTTQALQSERGSPRPPASIRRSIIKYISAIEAYFTKDPVNYSMRRFKMISREIDAGGRGLPRSD